MAGGVRPAFQSIFVPVPEVEALIDPFRADGDWSRGLGVPAHVTVAGPWPLSRSLPRERPAELAAAARGTRFRLGSVGLLGEAVCLFLADERPLMEWRERLIAIVGEPDGVDPAWRLHLTVCRNSSPDSLKSVCEAVGQALPIECKVSDLCLVRLTESGHVLTESL